MRQERPEATGIKIMRNTVTSEQAENIQIFYLTTTAPITDQESKIGNKVFRRGYFNFDSINLKIEVESQSLYHHIMESCDETTTPRGVAPRLYIVEKDENCWHLKTWGVNGNNPAFIQEFETEEAALNEFFWLTYEYDFLRDDQRDTEYFESMEDAQEAMIQRYVDHWEIDRPVVESILSKRAKIEKREEEIQAIRRAKRAEIEAKEDELATVYAQLIEPAEEPFKDTMKRLSAALPERLSKSLFIKSVKAVRAKLNR